jgi:hypothetical protein
LPASVNRPPDASATGTTAGSSRSCAELQERIASIAWAIRIATLTAITITSSQVITFVSSHGVERAQPRTVKNNPPATLIRRWGEVSTQLLRPLSALSAKCEQEKNTNNARREQK